MGTQLPLPQRGTNPQFSDHICCGQMVAWIKMSLGMELGLGPGDFVLDGDHAPLPSLKFSVHVCCGQTAWWIKMVGYFAWTYNYRPQPRRLCVRWRLSLPPQKGAEPPPQFSAHFYCGQTAGCINMPIGMEVGLSRGDFVLDGDPAPVNFRPMFIIVIVISLLSVQVQVLVLYAFYF